MDFVALDFETANASRSSPCSAGMVRFRGGRPVASWYELMRPPAGHDEFDPFNTSIHGITARDCARAPRFAQQWPSMAAFIGNDVLVAHNAAFDVSVLRRTLATSGLPEPSHLTYACSLRLSRVMLPTSSHRLPAVAEHLGVPFADHHNAAADARACGEIMVALMRRARVSSVAALCAAQGVPLRRLDQMGSSATAPSTPAARAPRSPYRFPFGRTTPPAVRTHSGPHPLRGKVVAFTGTLTRMTRADAFEHVAAVGGTATDSVTKRTNILVIGPKIYTNPDLTGPQRSAKVRRAATLKSSGADLTVLSEDEFLSIIGAAR